MADKQKSEPRDELKNRFGSHNRDFKPRSLNLQDAIKSRKEEIRFASIACLAAASFYILSSAVIGHLITEHINDSLAKKNYKEPLDQLNLLLTFNPFSDTALYNRARVLTKLKRYKDALADYDKVLQHNPEQIDALERRAAICVLLNRSEQVVADCNALLRIQGKTASVYTYADRAIAYSILGKKQNSYDDYSSAIRIKPSEPDFFQGRADCLRDMHRYDEAVEDYDWVNVLSPGNIDASIGKSQCLASQRKFPKALDCLNQAIKIAPSDSKLLTARGKIFWLMSRPTDALADFEHALILDSKNTDALTERMRVHVFKGDEEKALIDANILAKLGVTNYELYLKRADLQFDLGKFAMASLGYGLAAELKPTETEPLIRKAKAEARMKHFDAALEVMHSAVKIKPGDPELIAQEGFYNFKAKKTEAARADFEKALALNPNLEDAFLYRGEQLYDQQDFQSAKQDFEKVLRLDPASIDGKFFLSLTTNQLAKERRGALNTTTALRADSSSINSVDPKIKKLLTDGDYKTLLSEGSARYRTGDNLSAINLFAKAVKLNSSATDARRYLAAALLAGNYFPEAITQYQGVIALDPSNDADLIGLGKALFSARRYEEAIGIYNKYLEKKPHDLKATTQIILAYQAAGMKKKAQEACVDAIHSASEISELRHYEDLMKTFENSSSGSNSVKVAPVKDILDIRG